MSDLATLERDEWRGCARVIFDPAELVGAGFSQDAVAACTEVMESNPDDPKHTIFGQNGKPVNQMRGVIFLTLAIYVARAAGITWEGAIGWNTTLDRIRDAIRGAAAQAGT